MSHVFCLPGILAPPPTMWHVHLTPTCQKWNFIIPFPLLKSPGDIPHLIRWHPSSIPRLSWKLSLNLLLSLTSPSSTSSVRTGSCISHKAFHSSPIPMLLPQLYLLFSFSTSSPRLPAGPSFPTCIHLPSPDLMWSLHYRRKFRWSHLRIIWLLLLTQFCLLLLHPPLHMPVLACPVTCSFAHATPLSLLCPQLLEHAVLIAGIFHYLPTISFFTWLLFPPSRLHSSGNASLTSHHLLC